MRLDKFLKVSRLVKRRPLAKEMAGQGRIKVNGQLAKASTELKENDELVVQFGQKVVTLQVEALTDSAKKDDANSMYRIVNEEFLS